ncbi:MAG: mechanosensitive ion channel [Proteobacteria bacterium]|nr:mechanosensitive ion channel [Pseudomonadota bacterium]
MPGWTPLRHIGGGILALALALAVAIGAAWAQVPNVPAAPPAVAANDIEQLLTMLENNEARQKFVEQLRTLLDAEKRIEPPAPAIPDRIAGRFLGTLSDQITEFAATLFNAAAFLADAPNLFAWLLAQIADADNRGRLIEILGKVAIVLAAGWIAEWIAMRLLAGPRGAIEQRRVDGLWNRAGYLGLGIVLDFIPIIAFAAICFAALTAVAPSWLTSLIALALINANILARAIGLLAAALLAPRHAGLRLIPLGDETASYIYVWIRRIANLAVYGWVTDEAALLIGLPPVGHAFFIKALGVLIALMLIIVILQNKVAVGRAIAGHGESTTDAEIKGLRRRFGRYWHVAALGYVAVILIIWLLGPGASFTFELQATLLTIAAIALARFATIVVRRLIGRLFAISQDLRQRYPMLESRANRYLQIVNIAAMAIIYAFTALAVVQFWGIESLGRLATPAGRRIGGSVISIALTFAVALALWELGSAMLERQINRMAASAEGRRKGARLRTILPLLQRILVALLAVFVGLVVLSEIGVNITPLLAGAGVIGIAFGLGAQNLARDLISGVSLLLEDSIAVGDVVTLGDHSGVVEHLSLRSVRLRGGNGAVHTIPFSQFQTITNLTKDFAVATFDIGVSYSEDIDRVTKVLIEAGAELRKDPEVGRFILQDLEVLGIDSFADSAVMLKAQFRTASGKQWQAARAFNRRIKLAFDKAGIEIPFPQRMVHFVGDAKDAKPAPGAAPSS